MSFYINEDGEPYESDMTVEEQTWQYPMDDHVPYASYEDAQVASILDSLKPDPWEFMRKHITVIVVD